MQLLMWINHIEFIVFISFFIFNLDDIDFMFDIIF